MVYVLHSCRNSKHSEYLTTTKNGKKVLIPNPDYCNNGWMDKDLTNVKTTPPSWKYCRACCEKLGIAFEKQRPNDYLTEEQIKTKEAKALRLKQIRGERNENFKLEIDEYNIEKLQ